DSARAVALASGRNDEPLRGEPPDHSRCVRPVAVAEPLAVRAAAPGVAEAADLDQRRPGHAAVLELGDRHRIALAALDAARCAGTRARGRGPDLRRGAAVADRDDGVVLALD